MESLQPWISLIALAIPAFIGLQLVRLVRHYFSLPTLEEYREEFPDCATKHGTRCFECGAKAIWRQHIIGNERIIFSCRDCGEPLYRR